MSTHQSTRAGAGIGTGPVVAVAAALVLALALALDAPAVRLTAALAVCLVLPGLGWARRLKLRDLGDTVAMTVVLSLSLTAVVATGMAVTRTWSAYGGLAVLIGIAVLGFVPVRAVASRTVEVVLGRATYRPRRRAVVVDTGEIDDGWTDWYADARARSDEERLRREAEAEAAAQEWRDWYAENHRRTTDARSAQWDSVDGPGDEQHVARAGAREQD